MNADLPPEEHSDLEVEPVEPTDASDLDYDDMPVESLRVERPCTDDIGFGKDTRWEAFIPDDDELDPQPDLRDFWINTRAQ
jgi:hypothetical protein